MKRTNRVPLAGIITVLAGGWACVPDATCVGDWCGTAVVVTPAEARTLFPPSAGSDIENGLADLIFIKLADVGPNLNSLDESTFVPKLARSWSIEGPRTIRFALDTAARWHDDQPVTAADVVFTFDIYTDSIVAASAGPRLSEIASVIAPDRSTVVFEFRKVYAEQFFDAVYHMRILPRHLLDSIPRDRLLSHPFGRQPVGSGPYRFAQWVASEFVELAGDSLHFLGRPGIPRIIWRFVPDPATGVSQIVAGEADIMYFLGAPANIQRVADSEHARPVEFAPTAYNYVVFNTREPGNLDQSHRIFADRDLRRAIVMAVDREAVLRAVLGDRGVVPVGPVTPVYSIWTDTLPQLPFDSVRARRELARLGWTDIDGDGVLEQGDERLEFEIIVPGSSVPRVRASQIIQDQLRRVGVAMRIVELEFTTWLDRAHAGQFDAQFGGWQGDPSPTSIISELWTAAGIGTFNTGRFVNPTVDRYVRLAVDAPNQTMAREFWHRAIAQINADAPAIFMYVPWITAGVHRRLENVTFRADQWTTVLPSWRVNPSQLIVRDRFGVN